MLLQRLDNLLVGNLLLRMSVSRRNELYPKSRALKEDGQRD